MRRRIPIIINIEYSYHYTRPYSSALTIISPLKGELPFCETNIFLEYNIVPNCFKLAKLILERKNLISCQCISNINIYIMQLSPIGLWTFIWINVEWTCQCNLNTTCNLHIIPLENHAWNGVRICSRYSWLVVKCDYIRLIYSHSRPLSVKYSWAVQ